jgi:hypothetical protein
VATTVAASGSAPAAGPAGAAAPPVPAGAAATPSAGARMVCAPEAQQEIWAALGVQTSAPPAATWTDRVYACRYPYPSGAMVLSVADLPDAAATTAYYAGLQRASGARSPLQDLGEAADAAPDGTVIVRKDFRVLRVDVRGLPARFGQPTRDRAFVAYDVAQVIMACWTGA